VQALDGCDRSALEEVSVPPSISCRARPFPARRVWA
jgi:hypothetical protein